MKLAVYYQMWSKEGFKLRHKGQVHKFKRLPEAREFAKVQGFSGIEVKFAPLPTAKPVNKAK